MTIYSWIYIILALAILLYTVRQKMDLLSVASVCFIVYTIYCVPGIGLSGHYDVKLSPALYFLVYGQCILILVFSILSRRRDALSKRTVSIGSRAKRDDITKMSFYVYTYIVVAFAAVNILKIGFSGFAAGKANVWQKSNILYIISLYGAYPAFAYGIHNRVKGIWIPALLIELTIFFAGSRAFATTLAIIFLCEYGYQMWKKNKKSFRLYAGGAVAVVFLLIYRMIDQQVMNGDFSAVFSTLSKPEVWLEALEFNEPRVIIANYDYVLTQHFRLPAGDTVYRIIDFIPGMTRLIPIRLSYSEYFSTWLQESVRAVRGVGGTIWGESYAMFGVFGVFLFTYLWLVFIRYTGRQMEYRSPGKYFIVALGSYLAWYINRLEFNLIGQACKVMLLCFLLWAASYLVLGGELKIFRVKIRYNRKR